MKYRYTFHETSRDPNCRRCPLGSTLPPTRLNKPILNSAQLKNEEHFNLLITFILNEVQPTGTSNFPHLKIKFDLPLTEDSSLPFASFTWLAYSKLYINQ